MEVQLLQQVVEHRVIPILGHRRVEMLQLHLHLQQEVTPAPSPTRTDVQQLQVVSLHNQLHLPPPFPHKQTFCVTVGITAAQQ